MATRAPKSAAPRAAKPGKSEQPTGTASAQKKADILIAIGATGSGKSTRIKADMDRRNLRRLIAIDTMREYDGMPSFTRIDKLVEAVQAAEFQVRFFPSDDPKIAKAQFDAICLLAMQVRRVGLLGEELSNFVRANGGGPGWTAVMTRGRHAELVLYATSQRPALIDKTALSQATRLYCGNLEFPEDIEVMAKMLSTPQERVLPEEIQALGPWDFIEKHRETKVIHRGNLAQGAPL
jgi:hypothetical protein